MRKVLVAAVLVLALSVGAFAFQNEPEGFRDLKWGDPPTEDMRQRSGPGLSLSSDSRVYRRSQGDNLQIGGAQLESIEYRFYKGQFLGVFIATKIDNAESLKDVLELKFGLGKKYDDFVSVLNNNITKYRWIGDKATINLVTDRKYEDAELEIYSTEIKQQQSEDWDLRSKEEAQRKEQERQKAAEEGLDDF